MAPRFGDELELIFLNPCTENYLEEFSRLAAQGRTRFLVRPWTAPAREFVQQASPLNDRCRFYGLPEDPGRPASGVSLLEKGEAVDAVFFFEPDPARLSSALMDCLDREREAVVAPVTSRYFKKKPLFLISIPKSGTHLLFNLVQSMGYLPGGRKTVEPSPGTWNFLEYANTHTSARDFFIDTVRRADFGSRDHPFLRSPAIFIYRNPLDILVSEANYYPQEGKAAFYGYFQDRSFEERLLKLIDDPWLMGSFRDRIGSFLPWLDFKNVLPVSFEELVGPRGGGDRHRQVRTVWSLMLKLHVPGNAKSIADALFREDSPTFREATLGAHQRHFSERAYKKFFSLPQDFMEILGYGAGLDPDCPFPARAEEFRKRPLELGQYDCSSIPIAVNNDFLNYSIVKFRRRYYGVPNELGLDLNELDDADLAALLSGETEDQVKKDILLKDLIQQLDRRIHDHLRAHRPLKVLRPFVLWFFGPPETGKRNLIRKFQRSLETLSPDSVTVLSGDPWVRSQEERDPHPEAGASAVSELARKAEDLAQSGISVCIDLSFSGSQVRDRIRAVSPQFIAIDCVAPEAEEPLASSARTRQETASPETRETSETGTPSAESTLPESWVLALPWRDSGKSVRDLFRKLQEEQYIEFTHPQWEDELDSTLPQELETLMGAGSEVLVDPAALVEMQKKIQKLEKEVLHLRSLTLSRVWSKLKEILQSNRDAP